MSDPVVKRALVLGCGGVAGAAWTIATLGEIERLLKWDARTADVLIGTSSGAVIAALLGGGISVDRMLASQRGELENDCWNHDVDTGGARPPKPAMRFTAPWLLPRALLGNVHPMTALCGLLPRGQADMRAFAGLVDRVVPSGRWAPHPRTWIMTVDAATGQRVALGREGSPKVPLNAAVCASYAIPGWCPPVTVDGRTYLDGGIASPTSADMLLGTDVREAIVLAPMASRQADPPSSRPSRFARGLRRHMTRIVDREVIELERAGIRVFRIDPGTEDLAAFGSNMMNPKRRRRVFDTALRTAPRAVGEALDP
jgi:NTE family protein